METTINTQTIQKVKSFIFRYARIDKWNNNSASSFNDEAQTIIDLVARGSYGFASDIAHTVVNSKFYISEKQAYWIAKIAVENNLASRIDYLLN
jgi:hypothetical protein